MAECHPVGFRFVMEAKRRGAKLIHVDPRFTRTSALADLHVPLRPGTDIAFLGGIIRYILENGREMREYVAAYTNAAVILGEDFEDTEDLDGLFSGFDPETNKYDIESWRYEGVGALPAAGHKEVFGEPAGQREHSGPRPIDAPTDPTLEHPRCVFQVLKRHFARYTPDVVERITGVPEAQLVEVAESLCENSGRERTTAFCYAVGWTQHSIGVQYIRAASIVQLLLGNIGRPGGGILALRGHASIQGSTDIPTLYDILPGYMPMPHDDNDVDLKTYLEMNRAETGWWAELPKYMVSLLKAWFGDAATEENDFAFDYLPRLSGNHSHMNTVTAMVDGDVEGYFVMGENPVVGSPHSALQRKGMRNAKWVVVRDFAPTETAEFWRGEDVDPADIDTEVFFFPAAAHAEKDGAFTNTQRLLQWHQKAVEPPGDARSELHFVYHLGRRLRALYAESDDPKDRPIQDLTWEYPVEGAIEEPRAEAILAEINGFTLEDGRPVSGFTDLEADGSTACGCWIYAGAYADGVNQTARKKPAKDQSYVAPEWGWAWPSNRRLLYNRASADPEGRPWSERKKYVWWDDDAKKWTGVDVPDFIEDRAPSYRPSKDSLGLDAISGDTPFIMQSDARAWLFAPAGLIDGPLPTHYEPQESVVDNFLYGQARNPARVEYRRKDNPYHRKNGDPRYPFLLTTYRLTEHHTAGGMSRWLSWLSELQPAMFCEISPQLAEERGLEHTGWATVSTARGAIECRVLVTRRIGPLRIDGKTFHQIGLPYHFGSIGRVTGDAANELLGFIEDPNVHIMESKALTADIRPGRRERRRNERR